MEAKISVLMGVYNCQATLRQAVDSIQKQTYTNWELILCDDGSQDDTYLLAQKLAEEDSRITVIKNDGNKGLNITLNHCLQYATGDYIARMDGDDVSLPERFEKELDFLQNHPDYQIVSTPMILFDENGDWGSTTAPEYPTVRQVVCGSPICHAPVMMKRECMVAVGGYTVDNRMLRVEDVNLWIKLYARGYCCCNLQEPLYKMRNDKNAYARRKYKYRINSTYVRLKGCRELHLEFSCYLRAFMPMIIGLVPSALLKVIRRKKAK